MEGKTIVKVQEIDNGYQALKLDDESVVIVKVVGVLDLEALAGESKPSKGKDKTEKEDKTSKDKGKGKEKTSKDKGKEKSLTAEEIREMDEDELAELIEKKELNIDPDDFTDDLEGLQNAVGEELELDMSSGGESYTWEDLSDMDEDELKELITDNNLDTDPDDFEDDEDGLRKAIAKEIGVEAPKKDKKGKK